MNNTFGQKLNRPVRLTINNDLSFTSKTMSITETYREQLKVIAKSIDININNLLNGLTPRQVEEIIKQHKHLAWSNPDSETRDQELHLNCIEGNKGVWWFGFDTMESKDGDAPLAVYKLHDLEIQDVLNFMATIENVISV